jgi:hypothetical protein
LGSVQLTTVLGNDATHGTRESVEAPTAWTAAYGRYPQASYAHRQAIRAVGAAAQPVVLLANDKATLRANHLRSESREVVWLVPATLRVALLVSADEVELLTRLVSLE